MYLLVCLGNLSLLFDVSFLLSHLFIFFLFLWQLTVLFYETSSPSDCEPTKPPTTPHMRDLRRQQKLQCSFLFQGLNLLQFLCAFLVAL